MRRAPGTSIFLTGALAILVLGSRRDEPEPSLRGGTLAVVDGVAIGEADVRDLALARATPRPFGAEEQGARVSLAKPREPSPVEIESALEQLVDEEALVREAVRRGYEHDPVVRRRVIARLLEQDVDARAGCLCECDREPAKETAPQGDPALLRAALMAKARERAGAWVSPDAPRLLEAATRGRAP
ncbi:hypothetical protein HY251_02730 [bacterium]|nr:hypothetical protein [bacterium]